MQQEITFLANGGTEFNNTSSLYDLDYRNYDPVLGRMNGVDPMAAKFSSVTPYNFSFNNPVTFADPTGAIPNNWQYTYDDVIYRDYGEWIGYYNDPLGEHITPGSSGDWAMNVLGSQTSYEITIDFNQLAHQSTSFQSFEWTTQQDWVVKPAFDGIRDLEKVK